MKNHTVYSAWQRRREVPQIKMQGKWLEAAGITIGSALRVSVESGRLIIETAENAAPALLSFPQIHTANASAA